MYLKSVFPGVLFIIIFRSLCFIEFDVQKEHKIFSIEDSHKSISLPMLSIIPDLPVVPAAYLSNK